MSFYKNHSLYLLTRKIWRWGVLLCALGLLSTPASTFASEAQNLFLPGVENVTPYNHPQALNFLPFSSESDEDMPANFGDLFSPEPHTQAQAPHGLQNAQEPISFLRQRFYGSEPFVCPREEKSYRDLGDHYRNDLEAQAEAFYYALLPGMGRESFVSLFKDTQRALEASKPPAFVASKGLYTLYKMALDVFVCQGDNPLLTLTFFSMLAQPRVRSCVVRQWKKVLDPHGCFVCPVEKMMETFPTIKRKRGHITVPDFLRSVVRDQVSSDIKSSSLTHGARMYLRHFSQDRKEWHRIVKKDARLLPEMDHLFSYADHMQPHEATQLGAVLLYLGHHRETDYVFLKAHHEKLQELIEEAFCMDSQALHIYLSLMVKGRGRSRWVKSVILPAPGVTPVQAVMSRECPF
ncbi:MAG: hypothetical protein C0514_02920 [Candidatus Puniceispirillum sp.]|nr:hypothetical protein [Candidatus Puniceispirillum sp.]